MTSPFDSKYRNVPSCRPSETLPWVNRCNNSQCPQPTGTKRPVNLDWTSWKCTSAKRPPRAYRWLGSSTIGGVSKYALWRKYSKLVRGWLFTTLSDYIVRELQYTNQTYEYADEFYKAVWKRQLEIILTLSSSIVHWNEKIIELSRNSWMTIMNIGSFARSPDPT